MGLERRFYVKAALPIQIGGGLSGVWIGID
jgi:hypothetical protein